MGNTAKVVNAIVVTGAILFGLYLVINRDPGLPDYYRNQDYYWGKKSWQVGQVVPKDETSIRKFTVKVEESVLVDLKNRLKNTRLHQSIDGSNFEYGFNSVTLKKVLDHWSSKYDWRKFERELNKYPQFVTQIEGLDVHFFHVKPSKAAKEVKPLLLVHGWPGSAADFLQLIPDLTQNDDLAFELVIPCIPGFGWSEQSHKPGLNIIHIARIFAKLMTRLGHEHFVFHGDDWGSHIGKALGVLYPKRPIGVHVTLPTSKITLYTLLKIVLGSILPSAVYENPSVDVDKVYPLSEKLGVLLRESGYFHIQATKPDTIGAALIDSPAGLAAYLLDRVAIFTDVQNVHKPDGGLFQKFTLDQLCNFVTTTWVTNSITSSMRLYKESFSYHVQVELNFERVAFDEHPPQGIALPAKEALRFPKALLAEVYYNVTEYTDLPRGGHFIAMEEPHLLSSSIRSFVQAIKTKRLY